LRSKNKLSFIKIVTAMNYEQLIQNITRSFKHQCDW